MNAGPKKTGLIAGVTGQDGACLAGFLLKKGYKVRGIKRRALSVNTSRIDALYQDPHVESRNFIQHYGDMTDSSNLIGTRDNLRVTLTQANLTENGRPGGPQAVPCTEEPLS